MTGSRLCAGLFALATLAVPACDRGSPGEDDRLTIVATVSPITNLVQNVVAGVAGMRVTGLVPEGQNSHEFEPAPSDARVLAEADVIFVNGLNLETPSLKLAEKRAGNAEIIRLGEATIQPANYIYDFSFPRSGGDPNPHLWTNPKYAKRFADLIAGTLIRRDPSNAATYERNRATLGARFDALDQAVRTATATVPEQNRKLLTYHDSFPYFAREYGWTVIGAIQPSDFSEPTPREVARLIDQIKAEHVPAIFGSEVFPSRVLQRIATSTGARYLDDLRDDDLPGAPSDPNHSLLGLLIVDYRTIVEALGGEAGAFATVETANIGGDDAVEYRQ